MRTAIVRICVAAFVMAFVTSCIPAFAGEAEDDEAAAQREKEAREKQEADKKAAKAAEVAKEKEKAEAAKHPTPKPVDEANKIPVPNGPPVCPLCKGMEILPNLPFKPYIKFEGQPPPAPDFAPPWHYCEKCQKGRDIKEIAEDFKARQERIAAKNKHFEEIIGKTLIQFETPYISVHSQLTPATNKLMANALEKCAGIIETNFKSMVIPVTRADTESIVFLADQKTFDLYVDKGFPNNPQHDRDLYKKGTGVSSLHEDVTYLAQPGPPAETTAVFGFGRMMMENATNAKAPHWLVEGFGCYCENVTLNGNYHATFTYEEGEKPTPRPAKVTWHDDMRKFLKENKVKEWSRIFQVDLIKTKQWDYEACYSVVSFLIRDPAKFEKLVQYIKNGDDSATAVEKAYGQKIKDLQQAWVMWIPTAK